MDEGRALKRRHRRAKNRAAVEGRHRTQAEVGGNASPGDRKAADSGRQRSGAALGATLADVWPGARP
jgi:hypothetical protein